MRPSTSTLHAPQSPVRQPMRVPFGAQIPDYLDQQGTLIDVDLDGLSVQPQSQTLGRMAGHLAAPHCRRAFSTTEGATLRR